VTRRVIASPAVAIPRRAADEEAKMIVAFTFDGLPN